jgi:hypothetical protein
MAEQKTAPTRPQTAEQFFALPIGPAIGCEIYDLTEEDLARGVIQVRGETVVVSGGRPRSLKIPTMPETVVVDYTAEEPLMWCNGDGDYWTLGRYADGGWFRQRKF